MFVTEPESPPAAPRGGLDRIIGIACEVWPTVVMLGLAGLIGWWGHHTGWKMPKWSELTGATPTPDDWCELHAVPESACVECNPNLLPRPKSHGWCKDHGIPECPLCHPELAQVDIPVSISTADLDRAARSLAFAERPTNSPHCKLHQRRVQFASDAAVEKAGVTVEPVWTGPVKEFVTAPGEIDHDQTRVAHLSPRAAGSVFRVLKHLGDRVQAGDVLALIESAEVGQAKAELLHAVALAELKARTLTSARASTSVSPVARLREAEAAFREAEIRVDAARQTLVNLGLPLERLDSRSTKAEQLEARLPFLGLPEKLAATLDARTTSALLPLVAPMDGVVVSRDVVPGEVVTTSRVLFEVVDTSRLWLTFHVAVEDARRLRVGLPVTFRPDGGKEDLTGRLAWISTQADPKTRTVEVRADLPDPEGRQRANTFGTGRVILRDEAEVVVVPSEAVHWEGCCSVIFVRDRNYLEPNAPKVFHTRTVRIGAKDAKQTEIIAGVLPGELVAVKNSGVLRAELLRGNLGEG